MGKDIGRTGYLGIAIEAVQNTPEAAPVAYLPFSDKSLQEKHDPLAVQNAQASRVVDVSSVPGKKWGEGDVEIPLDIFHSGYLFKLALGNEVYTAGSPSVHNFYCTVSGNTPKTATLWDGRGTTDVRQYSGMAVNELELSVEDGLGTVKAGFIGKVPTTVAAPTLTTISGTVLSFATATVKFGATLAAAAAAQATVVNKINVKINNNVEAIYGTGSNDIVTTRSKGLEVEGGWETYFEDATDRDAYMALNKRAAIITFTGNANESVVVKIARMRINDWKVDTGLDDFLINGADFVAELDTAQVPNLLDITVNNAKAALY